jgi:hypothetical protein
MKGIAMLGKVLPIVLLMTIIMVVMVIQALRL